MVFRVMLKRARNWLRETQVTNKAARQGLELHKCRQGTYKLTEPRLQRLLLGDPKSGMGVSLDEVSRYLAHQAP